MIIKQNMQVRLWCCARHAIHTYNTAGLGRSAQVRQRPYVAGVQRICTYMRASHAMQLSVEDVLLKKLASVVTQLGDSGTTEVCILVH